MSRCRPRGRSWAAGGTFFRRSASYSWAMPAGSVSHLPASPHRCPSVRLHDTQTKLSLQPWPWCPWPGGWLPDRAQLVVLGGHKRHILKSAVKWYQSVYLISPCLCCSDSMIIRVVPGPFTTFVSCLSIVAGPKLQIQRKRKKINIWNMLLWLSGHSKELSLRRQGFVSHVDTV